MGIIQAHSGPTEPVSLNGISVAELDCSNLRRVVLQADLLTTPAARLYFRVDYGLEQDPCSPANAEGYITDGGTAVINLDPWIKTDDRLPHIYMALTDAAGEEQLGGEADRVLVYAERGFTELTR